MNTNNNNNNNNNNVSPKGEISHLTQAQLFNLSGLGSKKVEVKFTMEGTSNDGGLLLLREVEN